MATYLFIFSLLFSLRQKTNSIDSLRIETIVSLLNIARDRILTGGNFLYFPRDRVCLCACVYVFFIFFTKQADNALKTYYDGVSLQFRAVNAVRRRKKENHSEQTTFRVTILVIVSKRN